MMSAVIALLLGVAFGNPYSALKMENSWKESITYDWEELDHAVAFKSWANEFGKEYGSVEEEAHRFVVFRKNWQMINKHNIRGDTNFTMGLNQFGDLTGDEFRYYVHGHGESCLQKRSVHQRTVMHEVTPESDEAAPTSVDWTTKGVVTPVKNQGQCGSCWAFSTTGSIESVSAISTGTLTSLSEQQLVDCSGSYGNQGCNGGLMDNAFKYVEASGGLCSETEYPYTAKDGTCKSTSCGTKYDKITGYTDVTPDSSTSLESAVAMGPVSIAIEADQSAFQFYTSGVMSGTCGTRLDHGVLAVGYGTATAGGDYWKVKNSWGTSWGEQGYILICRNCNKNGNKGECGLLMEPSYPKV